MSISYRGNFLTSKLHFADLDISGDADTSEATFDQTRDTDTAVFCEHAVCADQFADCFDVYLGSDNVQLGRATCQYPPREMISPPQPSSSTR